MVEIVALVQCGAAKRKEPALARDLWADSIKGIETPLRGLPLGRAISAAIHYGRTT